jgi:hypothetical protein
VLLACFALSACGESTTDAGGFYINVGFQNSTDVILEVTATIDGSPVHQGFHDPGYSSTEVNGTSGDVVTFTTSFAGGAYAGSGSCTATNAIVGTNEYGQVNFYLEQPSGVFMIECSSGWLEFP